VALSAWPLSNCRLGSLQSHVSYKQLPNSDRIVLEGVVQILVYNGTKENIRLLKLRSNDDAVVLDSLFKQQVSENKQIRIDQQIQNGVDVGDHSGKTTYAEYPVSMDLTQERERTLIDKLVANIQQMFGEQISCISGPSA